MVNECRLARSQMCPLSVSLVSHDDQGVFSGHAASWRAIGQRHTDGHLYDTDDDKWRMVNHTSARIIEGCMAGSGKGKDGPKH